MRRISTTLRVLFRWMGAVAILALSFCGTLYFLDYQDGQNSTDPDRTRANTAKIVMAALEKYRAARGAYPIIPDRPLSELTPALVGGGFIGTIPPDPVGKQTTRYASFDGALYALLLTFDRDGKPCIAELKKTGFWGGLPPCKL